MKIMYIINNINIGGATDALIYILKQTDNVSKKVFCKNNYLNINSIDDIEIQTKTGASLFEIFKTENYDLIHFFKAESSILFNELCAEMKKKNKLLPIITTVCQYPREYRLRLTPNEIKYNQQVIFIDKHAFDCIYNKYIPQNRKSMIYFGIYFENTQIQRYSTDNVNDTKSEITFGRGSSLNKCHPLIIDWFNEIDIPSKKFIIAGIGDKVDWLKKEINNYKLENKIELIPHLPFEKWLEKVKSFDIFLYQIPLNSYSSIDGTMQAAMLLKKPVVYYGSEPPKELLEHGVSGFIANSKEEFIHYATLLASNTKMRIQMGEEAQKRILNDFNWQGTVTKYNQIYEQFATSMTSKTEITLKFKFEHGYAKLIYIVRSNLVNMFPKEGRKKFKRTILNLLKKN